MQRVPEVFEKILIKNVKKSINLKKVPSQNQLMSLYNNGKIYMIFIFLDFIIDVVYLYFHS